MTNESNDEATTIKALASKIVADLNGEGISVFYSEQMINVSNFPYLVKIIELNGERRNFLELLTLKARRGEADLSELIVKGLEARVILAKYQELAMNVSEKSINRLSRLLKKKQLIFPRDKEKHVEISKIFFSEFVQDFKAKLSDLDTRWVGLLTSPSGNGKSTLIKKMLKEISFVPHDVLDMMQFSNLKNVVPPPIDMVKSFLEEKIQRCCMLGKGNILVLENVDVFAKNVARIDFQQTQDILVSEVFTKFLIEMIRCYRKVRFLLVVEKKEFLNEQLNGNYQYYC